MTYSSFALSGNSYSESSGLFGKLQNKADRTLKKLASTTGVKCFFRLHLLCEGVPHGSTESVDCCNVHPGYEISTPGETLKKIAPVLLMANKLLSVVSVVGKVSGFPCFPSSIPGIDRLTAIASGYNSLIDAELDPEGSLAKSFDLIYGDSYKKDKVAVGDDPHGPPSLGDLLEYGMKDVEDFGGKMESESAAFSEAREGATKELLGSAYENVKVLIEELPTWKHDGILYQ